MAKTIIEEFVATLGIDLDTSKLKKSQKALNNFKKKIKSIGAVIAGGGLALFARQVEKVVDTSKALGVSAGFLENLGNSVKGLGFDFENVADIIEEMTNKINEIEESAPVKEAFAQLGLVFEDIKKLKPEEQFKAIADAALSMNDTATARSAVDTLMGGEANKIFGYLKSVGGSIDEIVGKQSEMDFQTDASRESAAKLSKNLRKLFGALSSFIKLFVGKVARFLNPFLESLQDIAIALAGYFKTNADKFFTKLGAAVKLLITALGLYAVYQGYVIAKQLFMNRALVAGRIKALAMNASMLLIPLAIGALILIIAALVESLYVFISSGGEADTIVGRMSQAFMGWLTGLSQGTGIVATITKGILAFIDAIFYVISSVPGFVDAFINGFTTVRDTVSQIIESIVNKFSSIFSVVGKAKSLIGGIASSFGIDIGGKEGEDGETGENAAPGTPGENGSPGINKDGVPSYAARGTAALPPSVSSNQSTNTSNTNNSQKNSITINASSGNAKDIANEVEQVLNKQNAISAANNNTGQSY